MSRTRRAITTASFQYTQLTLALVSGLVLFPLTIRAVGVHDFGLWLATGEVVGYAFLGDLGVFATLPWLIAAREGAGDRPGIARLTANGLAIGAAMALSLALFAASLWILNPLDLGIDPTSWLTVRDALTVMIGLTSVGSLFRPCSAILSGLQDVVFCGWVGLVQTTLSVGLTIVLVLGERLSLTGLAIAQFLPPVLGGVAAAIRIFVCHRYVLRLPRPTPAEVWHLIREGFGQWVGGFGVRMLMGSTSLILAGLGRTDEATRYAATAKLATLLQSVGWILPDSGLVALSQIRAAGSPEQARRAALSLLAMYLLIGGAISFAVLIANPALVRVWLGADLYAGHAVNSVIAINLVAATAVTGLFKIVMAIGYRTLLGFATLIFGGLSLLLSLLLGGPGGLAWVAAGPLISAIAFAIPIGLALVPKVHSVTIREILAWWCNWGFRTIPFLVAAGAAGMALESHPAYAALACLGLGLGYLAVIRPMVAVVPWPATAHRILARLRLVPSGSTTRSP